MTSLRRCLSPSIHDLRPLENGTSFSAVNLSSPGIPCSIPGILAVTPVALPEVSMNGRSSWMTDRLKVKASVWKKPFLHVIICFFVGVLAGLTPFSLPWSVHYTPGVHNDFAIEVKGLNAHVKSEGGSLKETKEHAKRVEGSDSLSNPSHASRAATNLLEQVVKSHQITDPTFGKLLIVITPTYNRPFQAMYLTRLSHTLKLVTPPLLWLVVEMPTQSMETAVLLRNTGLMYRHLVCNKNLTDIKDRGVHQRNVALAHIERHQLDGVVYFADDDNVYTLELFQRMRTIKRFGTWPVAMLTQNKSKTILEGPVCDGSKVIGWHTNEKSKRLRRFHVDMSGFAFNSTILWDPQRWQKPNLDPIRQLDNIKEGFQETTFIEQLVEDESQMEGLPSGCSKIMLWHLHIEAAESNYPRGWKLEHNLNSTTSFK